ncbi:MAG TPA: hypothetical protein PLV92_26760, partial [Pirellulaceae bacterium]|nr:hypothetical protein [Pirellulaceae bacterium]
DDLLVTGRLTVEVLADGQIDVPLRLTGGVIVEALVDGKPAQLRLAALAPPGAYLPSSVASASGRPAGPTPAINAQPQQPAVPQPNSPEQNDQQTATQPATAPPRQAGLPQSGPMQALMPQRGPVPPGIAGPLKPLAGAEPPVLVLTVAGRGRKEVELKIRMKLERRGGWRVAEGRLPSAPAASVNLRVAAARTEVRLGDVADRNRVETEKDNQRIETALKLDGAFSLQWRPKVAAGEVDRGLSATSAAEFDVREDGVRLVWQLNLQFPRGRRDGFSLLVPAEYLVEKVVGDNLRGWQAQPDGDKQRVEVVLLKTAVDQEQLTIVLSRRGRVGQAPLAEFALPVVAVGDTVLHQGTIAVRRSPWLDVRLADLKGLSRADAPGASLSEQRGLIEESPLGQRPLQSLKF